MNTRLGCWGSRKAGGMMPSLSSCIAGEHRTSRAVRRVTAELLAALSADARSAAAVSQKACSAMRDTRRCTEATAAAGSAFTCSASSDGSCDQQKIPLVRVACLHRA